jgi:hypothetical protein
MKKKIEKLKKEGFTDYQIMVFLDEIRKLKNSKL